MAPGVAAKPITAVRVVGGRAARKPAAAALAASSGAPRMLPEVSTTSRTSRGSAASSETVAGRGLPFSSSCSWSGTAP